MNARRMDPARYGYAQIESALALVFGANAKAQKGWLRGGIQNLKKLGLSPPSPGPGRAISYSLDDADKWLLGLEFGFLHIDPEHNGRLHSGALDRDAQDTHRGSAREPSRRRRDPNGPLRPDHV